jgi:hypothetical protein
MNRPRVAGKTRNLGIFVVAIVAISGTLVSKAGEGAGAAATASQ